MPSRGKSGAKRRASHVIVALVRRPLEDRTLTGFVLHRLRWALLALIVLFVLSTLGYQVLEHYSLLDASFMTVITLSTVGYGLVKPLNDTGRVFTIGVIIASFAGLVYAATTLTNMFTSGEAVAHLRHARGARMRAALSNHVIVVGFGRVGQAAARGVADLDHVCLVMERDERREPLIETGGYVAMIGDATNEAMLVEAGIHRALALVAATEEDSTNLIVTLTARAIRPDLRIISRVNEAAWQDRIVRAGANVAQSPYKSYGLSLAASAISRSAVELLTLPALGLATEEIEIGSASRLVGLSIGDLIALQRSVLIIGLRRDQGFRRWDEVDGEIKPGDVIVALGTPERVQELAQLS